MKALSRIVDLCYYPSLMNIFCGIDFGTTNTVVSICNGAGSLVDSFSVPTILFIPFENQGISKVFIGEEARRAYEEGMTGRYIHSIKRSLSDPYLRHTTINRTYIKLEELINLFLAELKKMIDSRWCIQPENIVLGRPVKFSSDDEENELANRRLLESFRLAGFRKIIQLEEPVAASLCFEEAFDDVDRCFLIADLGGGTSDFSLVSRDPLIEGVGRYTVEAIDGIDIGGDNFDEDLMYNTLTPLLGIDATFESFDKRLPMPIHLYKDICRWNSMHLLDGKKMADEFRDYLYKSDDPVAIHRLRAVIENKMTHRILDEVRHCKHQLSENDRGRIFYNELEIGIDKTVSGAEFSRSLKKPVDQIMGLLKDVAGESHSLSGVAKVILTGGSSRVSYIGKRTRELIGGDKLLMDGNFYNSVSKGLSLFAHYRNLSIMG